MAVYKIHHITRYEYDRPVRESVNEIKIYPYQNEEQQVLQQDVTITTQPYLHLFIDYWGNRTGTFSVLPIHTQLTIESKLVIRSTAPAQPAINFNTGINDLAADLKNNMLLYEYTKREHIKKDAEIRDIALKLNTENASVASIAQACCNYIYSNYKYIKGITDIETTVDDILENKSGVCQDFAHLMLSILRTLKIPSRYVSGYVCPNKNGMRGEGATHAWVDVWVPQYGWAGIDPTNNAWVTNNHIKLAVGRNFYDCTPVKGSFKGPAKQKLSVYVSVGYEDGHVFEDITNVHMQEQPQQNETLIEGYAGQQQQ